MDFFYAPDTCALATHIALEDVGAEYRLHRVSFGRQEQRSDEFLKLNPKSRVPVLRTDRGLLTETPAMLAYIAQMFPDAKLAPLDDHYAFAKIQAFNSYICSTLHVAHAHRMRGYRWSDDEDAMESMKRKVPEAVGACYRYIEEHELIGPYVAGNDYSIADPYLFTVAQWMESDGVDVNSVPRVAAHREMMKQRPAVQKALALETG